MNRELLTMILLGTGGGIKAIRASYPRLSERNVSNIASISTNKNNMHRKLKNEELKRHIKNSQLLRNAGGIPILRRNYPHLSSNYIHKIISRFNTVKQLRTFLNKKKPITLLPRIRKTKRLPPIKPISKSLPTLKALNNMQSLITVLEKKPMNMSKMFNSLPFNKTGVLKREHI